MVIDVHCHVGYSARRINPGIARFSFEKNGAAAHPGFDSYFSPRLLKRAAWYFVKRWLHIDTQLPPGDALDDQIEASNELHWTNMPSVDGLVILAFDEYHDDHGRPMGPAAVGASRGSDLYVSNSLVYAMCKANPNRYYFGASIHPYRKHALEMLDEVARAGAALIKWLPIHQNMSPSDARTIAFLRRAAELDVPMLIHYGGEMSLTKQHYEQESFLPMLEVLRRLRSEAAMPTVIVAHAATPSFIWQDKAGHRALVSALLGEFADAPLYADISALAAFGRTHWLRRLARMREVHHKLVWGSDFPIPVLIKLFWRLIPRQRRKEIKNLPSWIEQDYQLKVALGFQECVFTNAAKILKMN